MKQDLISLLLVIGAAVVALLVYRRVFAKKAQPKAEQKEDLSEEIRLQRENLAKHIIEYLSKEIETVTNGMMVFRSKISFAVLVGPFLILGALVYAAKGLPISTNLGDGGRRAGFVVCVCYLALAFVSGRIEEDGWRQCNKWRRLISDLQKNPAVGINYKNVRTDINDVDPVKWMKWSYLAACFLMIVSFLCLVFMLSRVQTTPVVTPTPAGNVASPTPGTSSGAGTVRP